jgi:hypothetical protein
MNLPLAASSRERQGLAFSSALPSVRVRFPARLFCKGRPLRSRERKLRGLDSGAVQRMGPLGRALVLFFQAEITLE